MGAANAERYLETESYAEMVDQKGQPPAVMSAKGLFVQFYPHPVVNEIKSWGGKLILQLQVKRDRDLAKEERARRVKAEEIVHGWSCGARLVAIGPKVDGLDGYEVEVEGAGRHIFDEEDYICIMVPGDALNIVRRPVWDEPRNPNSHTARFPEQWRAYKSGKAQQVTGSPLEHWAVLTRVQVAELKTLNIRTVEQLAELNDDLCGRFMGLTSLKQRAAAWLEAAKSSAPLEKLAADKRQLEGQIETMKRQMDEMGKQIAAQSAKK